jgi:hypothetical protein
LRKTSCLGKTIDKDAILQLTSSKHTSQRGKSVGYISWMCQNVTDCEQFVGHLDHYARFASFLRYCPKSAEKDCVFVLSLEGHDTHSNINIEEVYWLCEK